MGLGAMTMWVVYDHPRDYPDHYVAREHTVSNGKSTPTPEHFYHTDVDSVRGWVHQRAREHGITTAVCFPRHEEDETQILETWI